MKIKNNKGKIVHIPKHLEDQVRDHISKDQQGELQDLLDQNGVDLDDVKPTRNPMRKGGVIKYDGGGGIGPYFSSGYGNNTGPSMENGAFATNGNMYGSKSDNSYGKGMQTLGYATQALNMIPKKYDETSTPVDPNANMAANTAKSVASNIPVAGQFIGVGSSISGQYDSWSTQAKDPIAKTGLDYQSGMVDPLSGWTKNYTAYKNHEQNFGGWAKNAALHLVSPGLDTLSLGLQHRKNVKDQQADQEAANTAMINKQKTDAENQQSLMANQQRMNDLVQSHMAQGGSVPPSSPMFVTGQGTTFQDPYRNTGFGYGNNYTQTKLYATGGPIDPNGVNQMSQLSPQNYAQSQDPNKKLINVQKKELITRNGIIQQNYKYNGMAPHSPTGTDVLGNYVMATVGDTIIPVNQSREYKNMGMKARQTREFVLAKNQKTREKKQQMKEGGLVPEFSPVYSPVYNNIPKADSGIEVGNPRVQPYYNFNDPNASYDFMNQGTIPPSSIGPRAIQGQPNPNFYTGPANITPGSRFIGQPNLPRIYNPNYQPSTNNSVQNPKGFFDPNNLSGLSDAGASAVDPRLAAKTRNNSNTLNTISKYAALVPAAYNLAMGLFDKSEKLNANNYTNNQPVIAGKRNRRDDYSKLRDMSALAKYGINRSGNMSLGSYTNAISDLHNNYSNAMANADNMDLQMKFQADQVNSQTRDKNGERRFQVDDWNSRSKAGQRRYLDNAATNIGQYGAQEAQNQQLMDIYNRMYPKARRGGRV